MAREHSVYICGLPDERGDGEKRKRVQMRLEVVQTRLRLSIFPLSSGRSHMLFQFFLIWNVQGQEITFFNAIAYE